LLRALSHRPVRLSRKGTVTVVALRELALVAHDTPEAIGRLAGLLRIAGLAVPIQRPGGQTLLCPSTEADSWLELTQPHRWAVLAEALAERLPAPLARAIELADGDLHLAVDSVLGAEFPLLPHSLRAEATEWAGAAEQLGLAVDGRLTPAALELFAGTPGAAASAAERDFPPPAAGVYLQPDLSLIVPGPLAPADERALLEIVETEQLGVASTMRLSQMSLSRALRAGHEVGAIRELLERLSLTGIPQPLDFLLGDLERRRPGPDPE
ncbi:helicase-associated domain-containing protein, partial [Leucobacter soli]